jgi:hypothetical protein
MKHASKIMVMDAVIRNQTRFLGKRTLVLTEALSAVATLLAEDRPSRTTASAVSAPTTSA